MYFLFYTRYFRGYFFYLLKNGLTVQQPQEALKAVLQKQALLSQKTGALAGAWLVGQDGAVKNTDNEELDSR